MDCKAEDQRIFEELIQSLDEKEISAKSFDQLTLKIGLFFLGTPYEAGTLDTKGTERLVVNLRRFDCATLVETVVALAWVIASRKRTFEIFRSLLRKIRYRQGRLQGYCSRLHYFSDWVHDNQKKGIVKDVTGEIRGRPLRKAVNFMTSHPDLYPRLKNAANLRKMKSVERRISRRSRFVISKKSLRRLEDQLRNGDLIAVTTNTEGLDVLHVGLATRVKNRIHLLHASSQEGKVVVSRNTLYRYLMQSRARTGMMVARVC